MNCFISGTDIIQIDEVMDISVSCNKCSSMMECEHECTLVFRHVSVGSADAI